MGKRKSEFYHLRFNRIGLNDERTAEVLGVSVDDVLLWDENSAPVMAMRLLHLWDCKRVGFDGWEGFMFSLGVLNTKNAFAMARTERGNL